MNNKSGLSHGAQSCLDVPVGVQIYKYMFFIEREWKATDQFKKLDHTVSAKHVTENSLQRKQ
jgi:hypothetical protein